MTTTVVPQAVDRVVHLSLIRDFDVRLDGEAHLERLYHHCTLCGELLRQLAKLPPSMRQTMTPNQSGFLGLIPAQRIRHHQRLVASGLPFA